MAVYTALWPSVWGDYNLSCSKLAFNCKVNHYLLLLDTIDQIYLINLKDVESDSNKTTSVKVFEYGSVSANVQKIKGDAL